MGGATGWKATAGRTLSSLHELGRLAGVRFRQDECLKSAAAISYFALLSFLPFLVMILSALGFLLFFVGSEYASEEEFLDMLLKTTEQVLPFGREDLAERVRELIENRGTMGIVGVAALLLTSSLVFGATEDAIRRIFELRKGRNLVVSKLLFVAFVAAVGVFLIIGHYVFVLADSFVTAAGLRPLHEFLYSSVVLGKLVAYVGTAIAFSALLSYFCRRRIHPPYLLAGATVFFVLFEAAKWVFHLYLQYVAQFSTLYGSLSSFMVLTVWTLYTVMIFLFSAEIVRVLDGYGFWDGEEEEEELVESLPHPPPSVDRKPEP
jgi:membrane protein